MAVNTTTTQIYIPGFETNISSVVTPIVTTSNTAVASLSASLPTKFAALNAKFPAPSTSRDDSEPSPFPQWGTWTNQNNNQRAGWQSYDSEMQRIGGHSQRQFWNSANDTQLNNLTNWAEDFRSWNYTNGNLDAAGAGTYWGGSTVIQSADGNQLYNPSLFNNYSATQFNRADQFGQYQNRCGTIIGVKGVRQRVSHYSSDSEFQVRYRGQVYGYVDRVDLNSATYATWAGRTNRGMSSYNERTRTLVVLESNTSNQIRMHIWKNNGTNRSLNSFNHSAGTLHNFLSEAKSAGPSGTVSSYAFYDFTWTSAGSGRGEPAYHMKIIAGDNGTIGLSRFSHDGNAQQYAYFVPTNAGTPGNSGTGTLTDTGSNLGNTTSYGIDQDLTYYGIKHNNTWDNQWVTTYSPYYYYGCGINCHVINTVDPTKYYQFRNTGSTNGNTMVPYGESAFMIINSASNGDSPGPYLYYFNPGATFATGRRNDGVAISNGGDLAPFNVTFYYQFDTSSNTTQYPHLFSMPHWVSL